MLSLRDSNISLNIHTQSAESTVSSFEGDFGTALLYTTVIKFKRVRYALSIEIQELATE